jgi:hypothetical protein
MTDHSLPHDSLPTIADASGGTDFLSPVAEAAEAPSAKQRKLSGFGDGGKPNCPLFIINPEADPTSVNDFTSNAEAALDELLNEAVLRGGIEGDRAWLVEMLVHAARATTHRACIRD